MTEPHEQYHRSSRLGASHGDVHLSNQLANMHGLLLLILTKVEKAECVCNSKPKALMPEWLNPRTAFWLAVCVLAVGGHITYDDAKLLLTGLPK